MHRLVGCQGPPVGSVRCGPGVQPDGPLLREIHMIVNDAVKDSQQRRLLQAEAEECADQESAGHVDCCMQQTQRLAIVSLGAHHGEGLQRTVT